MIELGLLAGVALMVFAVVMVLVAVLKMVLWLVLLPLRLLLSVVLLPLLLLKTVIGGLLFPHDESIRSHNCRNTLVSDLFH